MILITTELQQRRAAEGSLRDAAQGREDGVLCPLIGDLCLEVVSLNPEGLDGVLQSELAMRQMKTLC